MGYKNFLLQFPLIKFKKNISHKSFFSDSVFVSLQRYWLRWRHSPVLIYIASSKMLIRKYITHQRRRCVHTHINDNLRCFSSSSVYPLELNKYTQQFNELDKKGFTVFPQVFTPEALQSLQRQYIDIKERAMCIIRGMCLVCSSVL